MRRLVEKIQFWKSFIGMDIFSMFVDFLLLQADVECFE